MDAARRVGGPAARGAERLGQGSSCARRDGITVGVTGGDPKTEELRIAQDERAREEASHAEKAELPAEERAAERRSDKAAYLREKLEEQQAADEDAG